MSTPITTEMIVGRIVLQGARREPDEDGLDFLAFSIESDGRKRYFIVPVQPTEDGYAIEHLETIERTLTAFGLELLPIDPNMMH